VKSIREPRLSEDDNVYRDVGHDVCLLRRRLALLGKVLPIPLRLEADEHLRDGIYRAVDQNGRRATATISQLAMTRTFRALSAFKSIGDYEEVERILDVLGLSPSSRNVSAALAKPTSMTRAQVSFFGHDILRSHLAVARRVSPLALSKRAYLRALWSILPFSFDLETKETLLDRCPQCKTMLDWAKSRGAAYCGHCGFDLRLSPPQPAVSFQDQEAMAYVTGTINPLVSDDDFKVFQSKFATVANRGEQFRLAARIALLSQRSKGTAAPPAQIDPHSLEVAGRALLRWPEGVAELAESISCGTQIPVADTDLFRLQYDQNFSPIIRKQLAAVLKQSRSRQGVAALDRQGLMAQRSPSNTGLAAEPIVTCAMLPAQDWQACASALRTLKAVRNVGQVLGPPLPDVLELYFEGYLPELRPELLSLAGDVGMPRMLTIPKADIESRATPECLPLSSARFALDVDLRISWSSVIGAISDGSLGVTQDRHNKGMVFRLRTNHFDVLRSLGNRPLKYPFLRNLPLTQAEVGMILGGGTSLGAGVVRSGLISERPTIQELANFRKENVFSFELRYLALMQSTPPSHLPKVLARAGVAYRDLGVTKVWQRQWACSCLGLP
jgi:hypothetical protein